MERPSHFHVALVEKERMSFHENRNIKKRRQDAQRSIRSTGSFVLAGLAFSAVIFCFFFTVSDRSILSPTASSAQPRATETTGLEATSTVPPVR